MRIFRKLTVLLPAIFCVMGCEKEPITIVYEQRLNFDVFDEDPAGQPHQTSGGGNAVYYIKSIKNPAGGETYEFKPDKLYYDNTTNHGWSQSWAYKVMGTWRAGDVTVGPGQTVENLGCVVVPLSVTPSESYVYNLLHNSAVDGDSVLMAREREGTVIPNLGTAYPSMLSQNCQP
jgi:hypothetical protein